jgi:hypothetical protein
LAGRQRRYGELSTWGMRHSEIYQHGGRSGVWIVDMGYSVRLVITAGNTFRLWLGTKVDRGVAAETARSDVELGIKLQIRATA